MLKKVIFVSTFHQDSLLNWLKTKMPIIYQSEVLLFLYTNKPKPNNSSSTQTYKQTNPNPKPPIGRDGTQTLCCTPQARPSPQDYLGTVLTCPLLSPQDRRGASQGDCFFLRWLNQITLLRTYQNHNWMHNKCY